MLAYKNLERLKVGILSWNKSLISLDELLTYIEKELQVGEASAKRYMRDLIRQEFLIPKGHYAFEVMTIRKGEEGLLEDKTKFFAQGSDKK